MSRKLEPRKSGTARCTPRLDRVLFTAGLPDGRPPQIHGYQVERDHFVRTHGGLPAYQRVRNHKNLKTGAIVGLQYRCIRPWLRHAKVTITAGALQKLSFSDVKQVFVAFEQPCLHQFELAFDFSSGSGVDRDFVLAHGLFAKSHPVRRSADDTLYYGTRKSTFFVRCYVKPELQCYRVEIQVHSSWLRTRNLWRPADICRASEEILDSRFTFVRVDFVRLHAYLSRTKGRSQADKIVDQVRLRSHALHRALRYLRKVAGINNVHRFLRPLPRFNEEIRVAVRKWQNRWGCRHAR